MLIFIPEEGTKPKQKKMKNTKLKKGDKITYTKQIMFKDPIEVTSKIIFISNRRILLEDGTTIQQF